MILPKRGWIVAGGCAVLLACALVYAAVRSPGQREIFAAMPAVPDLSARPATLRQRVSDAERRGREGPGKVAAWGEMARLYHANGFFAEASQCYRGLMQVDPANPRWPYLLGTIAAGFGQAEEALPLLKRVIALAPDYVPAQLRRGDALLKTNQTADAARAYEAVLQRDSQNPYALLGLARCDIAAERWAEARDRLRQASSSHPAFQAAWTVLAQVCERLGEDAEASAARSRVKGTSRFREAPDPWVDELIQECFDPYQLRVAAAVAGESQDARTELVLLTRAVEIAPDDAAGNRQLGTALLKGGEFVKARRHFEKAIELAPDESDNWVQWVGLLKAVGDGPGYDRALAAGLARCPNSPTLHVERGRRLRATNRLDEALADFQLAQRLRPNEAEAFVEAAGVYFRLGRLDDGMAEMRKALAAEPENPAALVLLARYAISTGDARDADEWLRRIRQQGRVRAEDLSELAAAYRKQFGGTPP